MPRLPRLVALLVLLTAMMGVARATPGKAPATATTRAPVVVPVIELAGYLEERAPALPFLTPQGNTVMDLVRRIDAAAADESVGAVIIRIQEPDWGLAQADEVRAAILRLRASGKPVYTSFDAAGLVDYYVASAATTITIAPVGALETAGIGVSLYYLRETLAKIGITADSVQTGDYKSAMEMFTADTPSPATAEQMNALLAGLMDHWVEAIAATRGWNTTIARERLLGGPYSSERAVELGLVDRLITFEHLFTTLPDELAPDGEVNFDWEYGIEKAEPLRLPSLFDMLSGRRPGSQRATPTGPAIAVVYALGPIIDGRSEAPTPFHVAQEIAAEDFIDLLDEATADPDTVALVLRIDSPGGSAIASDRIWSYIADLQEYGYPVVVSMGNEAASGGYYIAMGADAIYAQPSTLTGSIGVVGGKFTLGGLYNMAGIRRHHFSIGPNTEIFGEARPWDARERAVVQALVDGIYETFVTKAAEGRGMDVAALRALAGGRVYTGAQAHAAGLVDELGGLDAAIARARELADAPDARVVLWPRDRTLPELIEETLNQMMGVRAAPATPLATVGRAVLGHVSPRTWARVEGLVRLAATRPTVLAVSPYVAEFE
jgi:protease-4